MTAKEFKKISGTIPSAPGIYKYLDKKSNLLYVGKAKNLKKRVSSYFNKTQTSFKTYELVSRIHKIEFTLVDSEQDAFFLENALIKEYQPKYNIELKDDKSFPFIVIKNEPFPRVFLTRKKIQDGSEYLGPFTSVGKVRELISFIRQNIPLRTCKLNLTKNNIEKRKFKVCLEYHLGNCAGPCEGLQSAENYAQNLIQVRNLLKGNLTPVIRSFKEEMQKYAANLNFERAGLIKKKIEHLEKYQSKSTIVNPKLNNIDVFSIRTDSKEAFVNYLMVRNGTIVQTHNIRLEHHLDENDAEVLSFAIENLRNDFESDAKEIVVPLRIEVHNTETIITIPKGGDKKQLLDLSLKNLEYYFKDQRFKKALLTENEQPVNSEILQRLQDDLSLSELPVHIECFDNSNFQGSFPVAAMVSFKNGQPSKKDYRKFNIKTVKGINDFASMKEVVSRRYNRLLEEQKELPQLIIIDGGKGQLSAAMESIVSLGLTGRVSLIGLAKNIEEVYFPGDKESLKLAYNSDSLKLIRRIRDEVHRFGITFHRNKRSKGTFKNELEGITGIGSNTSQQLLRKFKSVKKIKELTKGELENEIGKSKAELIYSHFNPA